MNRLIYCEKKRWPSWKKKIQDINKFLGKIAHPINHEHKEKIKFWRARERERGNLLMTIWHSFQLHGHSRAGKISLNVFQSSCWKRCSHAFHHAFRNPNTLSLKHSSSLILHPSLPKNLNFIHRAIPFLAIILPPGAELSLYQHTFGEYRATYKVSCSLALCMAEANDPADLLHSLKISMDLDSGWIHNHCSNCRLFSLPSLAERGFLATLIRMLICWSHLHLHLPWKMELLVSILWTIVSPQFCCPDWSSNGTFCEQFLSGKSIASVRAIISLLTSDMLRAVLRVFCLSTPNVPFEWHNYGQLLVNALAE